MSEDYKEREGDANASETTAGGTQANTTAKTVSKRGSSNSTVRYVVIAVVVLALAGAALVYSGVVDMGGTTGDNDEATAQSGDPESVVATVNGASITRAELDERITQIRETIPEGTPDPTADAGFELQVLDELVNLKLLEQKATEAGFTVSEDDIAAEVAKVEEMFGSPEALTEQLTVVGLSQEEFESNVENELLIRQVIEQNTAVGDIQISEEEIQAAYDQAFAGQEGAPALEEVSPFIEDQLRQQQTGALLQAYIEEIRTTADIQIQI